MATIRHPKSLNPWQQYRQACTIYGNTSRAKNPAWYQNALDLDLQLHLRPDGPVTVSAYYNRKTSSWTPGPDISEEILRNEEQSESLIAGIIKYAHGQQAHAIGVILHVADEFATSELNPQLDNPAALAEMRKAAIENPVSILEDTTVDTNLASWRVLPYAAAGSESIGTTITITKQFAPFFALLRKAGENANFPIISHALSAPLVALMGMARMLPSQPTKPFVAILQYPWFTALAFFNEHADLKLVRTLQHRGMKRATNFRNALLTTSVSLEFLDPDLYIIPLGRDIDESIENNLRANFANCEVTTLKAPTVDGIPTWCPEPLIVSQTATGEAGVSSNTFTMLKDEQWALQDFLPTPREIVEVYPTKAEMNILRISRIMRIAIVLLAVAGLGFFGMGILDLRKKPEWSFNPNDAGIAKARLSKLNAERKRIDHWNNLLADRSKAWVVMESIARLFPEKGGMLVKGCSYTAKPDTAPGQSTIGIVKSWKITGFARDEALEYLNKLNTRDGINAHFSEIARITGNSAYQPDAGNRSITINVRTQENNTFRPVSFEEMVMTDETTYPFTFDLTITQRFEATDPMAITVPAAP